MSYQERIFTKSPSITAVDGASMIDLNAILGKTVTADEVNAAFEAASKGALNGVMQYVTAPLVSIDFRGNPHSAMLDVPYTKLIDGDFAKVVA